MIAGLTEQQQQYMEARPERQRRLSEILRARSLDPRAMNFDPPVSSTTQRLLQYCTYYRAGDAASEAGSALRAPCRSTCCTV